VPIPRHPLFQLLIDELPGNYSVHRGRGMEVATGPQFLTRVVKEATVPGSLTVLPQSAFYYAHHGSIAVGEDASAFVNGARAAGAYALHHWGHRTQEGELRAQ
jgi:hypothetical protein